jgi:group I intron endonuclease
MPQPISGIYQILNTATDDCYVGSSVNITNRRIRHVSELRRGKHINQRLQRAWDKYGETAFVVNVLEEVESEILIEREQWWIDTLAPAYNLRKIADRHGSPEPETIQKLRESRKNAGIEGKPHGGPKPDPSKLRSRHHVRTEEERQAMHERRVKASKGRTMSPEAREKIRQAHLGMKASPETLEKLRASHKGQKPTPETIEKNRQAQLGRKLSDEAREKIRQSKLGKTRKASDEAGQPHGGPKQPSLFD